MKELIINERLEQIMPPLTTAEEEKLTASLLEDGCISPLVVWKGILVDGHKRYRICQKHGIPFKTVEKDFEDIEAAASWIMGYHLAHRRLSKYQRVNFFSEVKNNLKGRQ